MMMSRAELVGMIETLRSVRGRHTGMVSLYLPPSMRVVDALAHVKSEMVESENVKDKTNRKSVLSSLTSLQG